jgi:hypothetical protein
MGKPKHSGKPELRTTHVDNNTVEITKDDHRNNDDFLKKHPHVKVVEKNSSKKIQKAHRHGPVSKHHASTKTKKHSSGTSVSHHKPKKPGQTKDISVNDEDENLLDNPDLQDPDNLQDREEESERGEYLHHEVASEEHDPMADLENYDDNTKTRYKHDAGPSNHTELGIDLPTDMSIDPNSFLPILDSSAGTTTFKASLIFNQDPEKIINYDDFDVIISQVTT